MENNSQCLYIIICLFIFIAIHPETYQALHVSVNFSIFLQACVQPSHYKQFCELHYFSFHIYVYLCVQLPYSANITLSIYCLLLSYYFLFCVSQAYHMKQCEKALSKYYLFCFYFAVICKQSRGYWLSIYECKQLPEVPSDSYLVIIPIIMNIYSSVCQFLMLSKVFV